MIHNLIPYVVFFSSRHQSQFRSTVKIETNYKTNKSPDKTMGPAKVEVNPPSQYLTKRSKEPKLPEKTDFEYSDADKARPPVPKHDEKPLMGLKSNKDFVKTNAVENIMSVPKKPAANFVDTAKGSTHPLEPSELMPKYTKKKVREGTLMTYNYTAKLLFHQSPTRHSDYTVTITVTM